MINFTRICGLLFIIILALGLSSCGSKAVVNPVLTEPVIQPYTPSPALTKPVSTVLPPSITPSPKPPVSPTPRTENWQTVHYDLSSWIQVRTDYGLEGCGVVEMVKLDDEQLWFGCWRGGIVHFDGKKSHRYSIPEDPEDEFYSVNDISVDQNGVVWIATDGQWIYRFDGKKWSQFTDQDGVTSDHVNTILASPDGTVWAGTALGLLRYDGKAWKEFTTVDAPWFFAFNAVTDLQMTPEGVLWIAMHFGFARFEKDKWDHFASPFHVENGGIAKIAVDPDGSLWLTNPYGGIAHYNYSPAQGIQIYQVPELDSQAIGSIHVTVDGAVWVGPSVYESKKNMVFCWDGSRWTVYDQFPLEGFNFSVDAIESFSDGSLLFSTTAGFFQFKASGCTGR